MTIHDLYLYAAGGFACALTSYLVGSFYGRPASLRRRFDYAAISGAGAVAICWLGCKYFPDKFDSWDSIPYSILIGLFGIGRVLDWIVNRYGLGTTRRGQHEDQE